MNEKKLPKSNLIFIGGAPGVGKSTIARNLSKEFHNSIWLDGDDLWRMNPFSVNDKTKAMVLDNIKFVLNSFLSCSFSTVIFTWVLHLDAIVESIQAGINYDHNFFHFTLICNEAILLERIDSDKERTTDISLALDRLHKSRFINSEVIDTSRHSPEETVNLLKYNIIS